MRVGNLSRRGYFTIVAICAVVFLVVLPALPDGSTQDAQWVLSVVVAVTGLIALVAGIRSHRGAR